MYDWGKPFNIVMKKVYAYDSLHKDVDIQCTANAIVYLWQDRDNQRYDVFISSDKNNILKILCTRLSLFVSLFFVVEMNIFFSHSSCYPHVAYFTWLRKPN